MESREFDKMYRLENTYWWFVGRRGVIRSVINRIYKRENNLKILDVGCGTGSILNLLNDYGEVAGSDISEMALSYCRKRGFSNLFSSSADNLEAEDGSYDLVTAFDILEHIEDDVKVLGEFHRVCKEDGKIIITVPAYMFLWSEHDQALEHKRRYARKELHDKISSAGFKIKKISYFVTFMFPAIALFRILQNIFKKPGKPDTAYIMPPKLLNNIFIGFLLLEGFIINFFNIPFGVSLICLAEKKK